MERSGFEAEWSDGPAGRRVRLAGELTLREAGRLRQRLAQLLTGAESEIDLSGVRRIDGGAAAVLAESWGRAQGAGRELRFVDAPAPVRAVLDLYTMREAFAPERDGPPRESTLAQIGRATADAVSAARGSLEFLGGLARAVALSVRRPRSVRWRDVVGLAERHGSDALPITLLIGALIGMITAFQAAMQLTKFGADSLVADAVGLSITRELGPLMTAIVIAGRSGAAIAAEVGTMKVSEEVDALRTLGFDPYRFLVLPRILAVVCVAPLLTLLVDLVGLIAGLVIALLTLDVGWRGYLISTEAALSLPDIFGGVLKAFVFGGLIATLACERGLAATGGAVGVGRATTSAVVAILFHLILADAFFAVLFNLWGI